MRGARLGGPWMGVEGVASRRGGGVGRREGGMRRERMGLHWTGGRVRRRRRGGGVGVGRRGVGGAYVRAVRGDRGGVGRVCRKLAGLADQARTPRETRSVRGGLKLDFFPAIDGEMGLLGVSKARQTGSRGVGGGVAG